MTYDVQMHSLGISIGIEDEWLDENLPGQLNLTYEELGNLAHDLRDAYLASVGLERHEVTAKDIEEGDIFGDTGLTVTSVFHDMNQSTVHFGNGMSLTVRDTLLMTVNRRIQ